MHWPHSTQSDSLMRRLRLTSTRGAAAGAGQVPDVDALDLVAHLDAAHALDALVGVPVEGEIFGPKSTDAGDQVLGIDVVQNAQVVGDGLQLAVAAAHTGGALAVMLGKDQLHIDAPGTADARRCWCG